MARQVFAIAGAVAGFALTGTPQGAQYGYMAGAFIGGIVDPIEMQGNKLGDAAMQVAAAGGARAIVFGKGCVRNTCILERGGRRIIKQRDSSGGKGSGPTTINQRALWTYQIGLGEAMPGGAILRIWKGEKLVYDVTPETTIPEESAAFAEKFRFYDGSEDQLPDPAIEAIYEDPDDAPYYRGTASVVFPQDDLTDNGEAVWPYRFEVAANVIGSQARRVIAIGQDITSSDFKIAHSADAETWEPTTTLAPTVIDTFVDQAMGLPESFLAYGNGRLYESGDPGGYTWNEIYDFGSQIGGAWTGGTNGDVVLIPRSFQGVMRISEGLTQFDLITSIDCTCAAFNDVGVAMSSYIGDLGVNVSVASSGSSWAAGPAHGLDLSGGLHLCGVGDTFALGGRVSGAPAMVFINSVSASAPHSFPGTGRVVCLFSRTINDVEIVLAGLSTGQLWKTVDRGMNWTLTSYTPLGTAFPWSIDHNGTLFVVGSREVDGGNSQIQTSPDGDDWDVQTQPIASRLRAVAALYPIPPEVDGDKVPLGDIIAALHQRVGHTTADYDVSELTELSSGLVIDQTTTAAPLINAVVGPRFADPVQYDDKIRYIKRGKPVVATLTVEDLIDEPETNQRKNSIEYPLKVHFFYQGAREAYASPPATSSRYSKDLRNVGEVSVSSPETFEDGEEPAGMAAKLHKVLWTEAEGEIVLHVTDEHIDLVPTDCVGWVYKGTVSRLRITQIEDEPGQRKLKMVRDRQSAYTSNVTEIPVPPAPTPPQPSTPALTVLNVLDVPALTDSADTLHKLVAMSGANDNWAGAVEQRSTDGGASFDTESETTINAIMGSLTADVSAASPFYTDGTNEVVVTLFATDEIASQTFESFMSMGGAFALSYEAGGVTKWELMQYQDAELIAPKTYRLTTLLRGRKDTEGVAHPSGSRFVLFDSAVLRVPAQSSWLGTTLQHRAISNGRTAESATPQANLYVGNSQREWPVALLNLERAGDDITATAIPRHRFGTSRNPIRSVNWTGYRWVATDGSNTITRDGTAESETFDTTGWASPVSVTVSQLNRLTGAGDAVTEEIA